jgi:hypothetical protein
MAEDPYTPELLEELREFYDNEDTSALLEQAVLVDADEDPWGDDGPVRIVKFEEADEDGSGW